MHEHGVNKHEKKREGKWHAAFDPPVARFDTKLFVTKFSLNIFDEIILTLEKREEKAE